MNAANALSLARLLAVPLIVWLLVVGAHRTAFYAFVAAGVSDAIDGYLAKHFGMKSEIGRYLDPLADKTLLVAIYITLGLAGWIPAWLTILVVSRDVLIVGGALLAFAMAQKLTPSPLILSKVNTAAQIALAAGVLGNVAFDLQIDAALLPLVIVVGGTTVLSGGQYLWNWSRNLGPNGGAQ
jgi:cardiolipin synthase